MNKKRVQEQCMPAYIIIEPRVLLRRISLLKSSQLVTLKQKWCTN